MPANRVVSNPAALFDGRNMHVLPERKLWAAVILQAIKDALWVDPDPSGPPNEGLTNGLRRIDWVRIRDEALVWLIYDEVGFKRACDLAGFDPDYLRRKVRAFLGDENGTPTIDGILDA